MTMDISWAISLFRRVSVERAAGRGGCAAWRAPFELLLGGFGFRKVEGRGLHGHTIKQAAFSDRDDIFVSSQPGRNFYPTTVSDSGLDGDRFGSALFDDEQGFAFRCADHGLWRYHQRLWNVSQRQRDFCKGTGTKCMVCIR